METEQASRNPTSEPTSTDDGLLEKLEYSLVRLRVNTLVVARQPGAAHLGDRFAARLQAGAHSVSRIDASVLRSESIAGPAYDLLRLAGGSDSAAAEADDLLGLLDVLAASSHAHNEPRFIVVDQIRNVDVGYHVFGRMRDELWELKYRWAVFIDPGDQRKYRTPPADTFFSTVITVDSD